MQKTVIKDLGKNVFIPIPKSILKRHKVKAGDTVSYYVTENAIIIGFKGELATGEVG